MARKRADFDKGREGQIAFHKYKIEYHHQQIEAIKNKRTREEFFKAKGLAKAKRLEEQARALREKHNDNKTK